MGRKVFLNSLRRPGPTLPLSPGSCELSPASIFLQRLHLSASLKPLSPLSFCQMCLAPCTLSPSCTETIGNGTSGKDLPLVYKRDSLLFATFLGQICGSILRGKILPRASAFKTP